MLTLKVASCVIIFSAYCIQYYSRFGNFLHANVYAYKCQQRETLITHKFWGNGMLGFHCFRIFYWKKGIQKRTKINVQNRPKPGPIKTAKTVKTPPRAQCS